MDKNDRVCVRVSLNIMLSQAFIYMMFYFYVIARKKQPNHNLQF